MKKITLSADAHVIEQARRIARAQHKTLNTLFREWLAEYTARAGNGAEVKALMKRLQHVNAGRHFTRDEMNERN